MKSTLFSNLKIQLYSQTRNSIFYSKKMLITKLIVQVINFIGCNKFCKIYKFYISISYHTSCSNFMEFHSCICYVEYMTNTWLRFKRDCDQISYKYPVLKDILKQDICTKIVTRRTTRETDVQNLSCKIYCRFM